MDPSSCALLIPPMERGGGKEDSQRAKNKVGRKRRKFMHMVQRDLEEESSVRLSLSLEEPSQWLVVSGCGLGMGTPKREVRTKYPSSEEIRYVVDKCYAFIRFKSPEEAEKTSDDKGEEERFVCYLVGGDPPQEDTHLVQSFFKSPPPGLQIIKDFVTLEEETLLLREMTTEQDGALSPLTSKSMKHRWVRHFGYEFRYGSNDVDFDTPLAQGIPQYLKDPMERMKEIKVFSKSPEQLTVNQYQSGQGIPPHVDTHNCFETPIVSLSLGAEVVMNFRRGEDLYSTIVPRRSLLVMGGESRLGWTHGISNRTFDIIPDSSVEGEIRGLDILLRETRTSFTFRKLKVDNCCNCEYPEMCNSQKAKITEENASSLEDKLVHSVYEKIASHFHETRHKPWPRVKMFVESVEEGGLLLDVGCGNGKYFNLNGGIIQIGTDMSLGLLEVCRTKNNEVLRANALQIPFKDESFQAVICIAVLHHISTKERRLAALEEMMRVMTKGGQALIYVWAKDQHVENEGSVYASHTTTQDSTGKSNSSFDPCDLQSPDFSFLPIHHKEADFKQNDVLVPWVNAKKDKGVKNKVEHRYYHVFDKDELQDLIMTMKGKYDVEILETYYDQGNWVVRFRKN